jgi:hypothetical protein
MSLYYFLFVAYGCHTLERKSDYLNWFQVHIEFKRQCLEMTVDKLLEQFVLNKYTGLEKPGNLTCFSDVFLTLC